MLIIPVLLPLLAAHSIGSVSQPTDELQARFNQVFSQVHKAEAAGATPNELAELVALLNKAPKLNDEALSHADRGQRCAERNFSRRLMRY